MKTIALCALVIGGVILSPAARAQIQEDITFVNDPARLEQMVAPVALYPDTLLMQVLMASTYPLEVIEAERFARENAGLSTEAVEAALPARVWDPSVKALVAYPDVLRMMSENVGWMRDLGDAFLADESAVLDAVQRMRLRAYEAGTLTTTAEQTVTYREDRIIVIEPVTRIVYVPQYSPVYAYGDWSYPYWYYPSVYRWWPHVGLSFHIGSGDWAFWGSSWFWGRPYWAWGASAIWIDIDIFDRFHRRHGHHGHHGHHHHHHRWHDRDSFVRDGRRFASWRHDPDHRRGVRYRDRKVASEFAEASRRSRIGRENVVAPGFEGGRDGRRFDGRGSRGSEGRRDGRSFEQRSDGRSFKGRRENGGFDARSGRRDLDQRSDRRVTAPGGSERREGRVSAPRRGDLGREAQNGNQIRRPTDRQNRFGSGFDGARRQVEAERSPDRGRRQTLHRRSSSSSGIGRRDARQAPRVTQPSAPQMTRRESPRASRQPRFESRRQAVRQNPAPRAEPRREVGRQPSPRAQPRREASRQQASPRARMPSRVERPSAPRQRGFASGGRSQPQRAERPSANRGSRGREATRGRPGGGSRRGDREAKSGRN